MANFIRLALVLQFYALVFFAVSEFSVPFASACYNNNNFYCNEYPPDTVECDIHYDLPNSTLLGNALAYCTEGKSYHRIYIVFFDFFYSDQLIEIPLNVSDNVTSLEIISHFGRSTVRIHPLKEHLNMTSFSFRYSYLDLPKVLSSYFPNLQRIEVFYERSINTIDSNLFRNLASLSYLSWSRSTLVNISEDSFRGLSSLSYIDLSSNSISYLSSETFQHLPSLNELIVENTLLNCTCRLQWMSMVDSNYWIDIVGECEGSGEPVDSPSTYLQCHSTESYQCFNKSVSCDSVCINTASSYICVCAQGYGLTLLEAEQACHDIDECTQNPMSLCEGMNCRNSLGSYQCYCEEGFLLADGGGYCSDIDECISNPCDHFCNNTLGSYLCSCYARFVLNRDKHSCQCRSGYEITADRTECVDKDECLYENGGCDHLCINTVGSYTCACYANSSLSSDNAVQPVSALFMGISIIELFIISGLVITLIITCVCWKRGISERKRESIGQNNRIYTDFQPKSVPKSEPGEYMYIDGQELMGTLKGAPYPGEDQLYTQMSSPGQEEQSRSHYMNLNDM